MKEMTWSEFENLVANRKVIGSDKYGDKVFVGKDKKVVKIFRPREGISTSKFSPYIERFVKNSEELHRLGIPTVHVENVYHIPSKFDVLTYSLLEGVTLREFLKKKPRDRQIFQKLASFIVHIHHLGIYFRAIHFGNIVILPNGDFGLIDLVGMKTTQGPLNFWLRARNFKIFSRYREDYRKLLQFDLRRFFFHYLKEASLSPSQRYVFLKTLILYNHRFALALKDYPKMERSYR